MDLLAKLLTGGQQAATPHAADDFWYEPVGTLTAAGVRVDAEGAKKISAWFRGRDILATSLAMLPLQVYERLPEDAGSAVARTHRVYDALHRKPSLESAGDSFTWRRQAMYDLIDHGRAYDWVTVGSRWSLRRIDPTKVEVAVVKVGPRAGRRVYVVRDDNGQSTTHAQEEIFCRELADRVGILEHARESLGLARVTESYAGRIFGNGSLAAGSIETPGPMDSESARALAQSFKTAAGDWHMPRVLPSGAKYVKDDGLTPEKAQMLLSRKFSITDIARWLGLPPHMLGDLDRATFSNIEHQGQEFVTYALGPWLSLWEFAINDQLMLQPERFYAEFTRDALVRGDIATRWLAHVNAVNAGIKTVDEVRRTENLNRRGGQADQLRVPQNITGKPLARVPVEDRQEEPEDNGPSPRARAALTQSASRLLAKEIAQVQKLAVQHAMDQDAFAVAVTDFYASHAPRVAEWFQVDRAPADAYCAGQAAQVVSGPGSWVEAVRVWRTPEYAEGLIGLLVLETA